jgi:hypothetical protein
MQLSPECNHQDARLSDLLTLGTKGDFDGIRIDLPYCLTTNPFIIIREAVIGQCYSIQYAMRRQNIRDPKVIDLNLLMGQMTKSISLCATPSKKIQLVKNKMDEVISYGEEFELFSDVTEENFRINCRGERPDKVKDSLEKKFYENWSYQGAQRMAKEKAKIEMMRITPQKDLSFFDKRGGSRPN